MLLYIGSKETALGELELRAFLESYSTKKKKTQACNRLRYQGKPGKFWIQRGAPSTGAEEMEAHGGFLMCPRSLSLAGSKVCGVPHHISDLPNFRIHKTGTFLKLSANSKHGADLIESTCSYQFDRPHPHLPLPWRLFFPPRTHTWNRFSVWKYFWHPQILLAMATGINVRW